jgi:hypothetical protein
MEGDRKAGAYETNTDATLHYINYLGNSCTKATVTPAFPWPKAVVGYGFYLVDVKGKPLNKNGDICSFMDSVKLSDEIKYFDMLLNADGTLLEYDQETLIASVLLSESDLDAKYDLYDRNAEYKIYVDSTHGNSYWKITAPDPDNLVKLVNTTYVTNYGGVPTTKVDSQGESGVAYDRTVVWFALMVTPSLEPDVVVIDYGLSVEINVLNNDG